MRYVQISETIFHDLLSAKAKLNDINELVTDWTFRPNSQEWREILRQIINSSKYVKEDEHG